MTIAIANVANTNTFDYWKTRHNEIAYALSTQVITVNSNTTVGNVCIDGVLCIGNSSINTVANSSTVTSAHFDNVSDISLKENVFSLDLTDISDTVLSLNPVSFTWKSETGDNKKTNYGFIAQEIEELVPDLVTEIDDGIKTVSYMQLIPMIITTLQKQQQEIKELRTLLR